MVWGNICSANVFNSEKFYSYIKKTEGTYNYVVILNENSISNLIKNKYIIKRKYDSRFKPNTSLATIKSIPLRRIASLNDRKLAEFLAGWFDSDGTIRPKFSELSFALDTQLATREEPLAYSEIKLLKLLEAKNKVPKLIRIKISYASKLKDRAFKFFETCKNLYNNTCIAESESAKGVKINAHLSCNVRARTDNRESWIFWVNSVVPRLFREDKKLKFIKFFRERRHRFVKYQINLNFYKELSGLINKNCYICISRRNYPECRIKLKDLDKKLAKTISYKINKFLYTRSDLHKSRRCYTIEFYFSPNNFEEFEKYIIPELNKDYKSKL